MQKYINKKLDNNKPEGFPKKIGGVMVDNPIWLAPLAGITFSSIRSFYKAMGVGLVHTEMISAVGLYRGGRKTKELLNGKEDEHPVALQLFASNSEDIVRGAEIALNIRKFDAIEVNMACPMPKVTKRGSGSKLLENPYEAANIIKKLKPFGLPVWSKIRIMPKKSNITTCDFCENLFTAGADYIFVHGRTAAEKYGGIASRNDVQEVALRFPGLIGGSGDCYTAENIIEYFDKGCSTVLAARGILRDAFLIPKTLKLLGCDVPTQFMDPDMDMQTELLLELGHSIYNTEGESSALMISRRMLAALFKGFPGVVQLRRRGALVRTWQEMEDLLINWKDILLQPEVQFTKERFPRGIVGEFE